MLSDLRETGINFSDPWWDQNSIESFELGGVLFGAVSDITFFDKISTYVTFFIKDESGLPVYHLTDPQVVLTLERIYTLMLDSRRFFNRQSYGMDVQDAVNMFTEERVMFMVRPIQSLFMMREMGADFGIATLPKMNASDPHVGSAVNPYSGTLLVLPRAVKDKARAADVLQALACESRYTVREPLFDVVLGAKLTRDERSVEMLNIAFDNRVYDIGLSFDFGGLADKLLTSQTANAASKVKSWERSVGKKIDALIAQIEAVKEA